MSYMVTHIRHQHGIYFRKIIIKSLYYCYCASFVVFPIMYLHAYSRKLGYTDLVYLRCVLQIQICFSA